MNIKSLIAGLFAAVMLVGCGAYTADKSAMIDRFEVETSEPLKSWGE